MAETHRAVVVYVTGGIYAVDDAEAVAALLKVSIDAAKLKINDDGSIALLGREDVNKVDNQMVRRIEMADVICTPCEDLKANRTTPGIYVGSNLGDLIKAIQSKDTNRPQHESPEDQGSNSN